MKKNILLVIFLLFCLCGQSGTSQAGGGESQAVYERGLTFYQQGRFSDARRNLEESLRLEPRPEANYYLGYIYLKQERTDLAEKHFKIFLEQSDDSGLIKETEAILAEIELSSSRVRKAEDHLQRGLDLKDRGLDDLAIIELKGAIELDPDLADAHFYLGEIYFQRGQYNEAIDEYRKSGHGYR